MPLDNNDKTRIFKYEAYELSHGSKEDGIYSTGDVLDLLDIQIASINDSDAESGTTIGDQIKAGLDQLDTLDASRTAAAGQAGVKILGIGSGIEYFQGGATVGFKEEFEEIRGRIARMLALRYTGDGGSGGGYSIAYRG